MSDQAVSIVDIMLIIVLVCLGLGAIVWQIFSCEEYGRRRDKLHEHEETNRTDA